MPKTKTPEPDLTKAAAASELGVAIRTINKWIGEGKITPRPHPIGAGPTFPYVIPRDEVDRLKNEMQPNP